MAQIIQFPNAGRPSFVDWMNERFEFKKWCVVKSRRFGGKFNLTPDRHAPILQREFDALVDEYESKFGQRYA